MEKRQGALYFDREEERYNIRFGLEECYHGLYCGEGLEVLVGKRWVRTRIEKAADWYLVGIDTDWLDGLRIADTRREREKLEHRGIHVMAADWYLVGIDTDWLDGLRVRV